MPSLGEIHGTVGRWLRRGDVFNVDIPGAVRMAARSVERNYTLKYMESYVTFTISAVSAEPRAINLPTTAIKKIQFIKLVLDDGSFYDLTQMDPRDLKRVETGQPQRYWLDGMEYIWFDKKPDRDYSAEMLYDKFTTWPTDLAATNWLIDNGEDMLVGHALSHMKILARLPPDIRTEVDNLVARGMKELISADEEFRNANSSMVMNYGRVY